MSKLLIVVTAVLLLTGMLQAQIILDGDSTDWAQEPTLIEWIENPDGFFPGEVGAITTDIVDIKHVKLKVIDDALYSFKRHWGGPCWPNHAYKDDPNHPGTTQSRGHYHILLDLDNDPSTGWDTRHYEGHETTVGYIIRTLPELGYEHIGAEQMSEVSIRTYWGDVEHPKNTIQYTNYQGDDWQDYISETDEGFDYDMYTINVNNPDSTDMMMHQTCARVTGTSDATVAPLLDADTLKSYWGGHAWGYDFLETGWEMEPMRRYWTEKGFPEFLAAGSTIGFCGFNETPIDDWGCETTTRGEFTLPAEIPERPNRFTFDGDSTDWMDVPTAVEWIENPDGFFPGEVGAVVTDIVDIKHVKAVIDQDNIYYFLRMWGGPVWMNDAYQDDPNHPGLTQSRGYYHIALDLDNDPSTGWDTRYYEAHESTVGYVMRTLPELGYEAIGCEAQFGVGVRTNWADEARYEWEGGVREVSYYCTDYQDYISITDEGFDYSMFGTQIEHPDTAHSFYNDGMLVVMASDDETMLNGRLVWVAHAWGYDFLEAGTSLWPLKQYWMNKNAEEVLQDGATIGICGFTETPIDDWGCDMTNRGEITVVGGTGIRDRSVAVADKFALANNYPNPFNPVTTIDFSVPKSAKVSLVVYNALGQKVRTLVDGSTPAGAHSVQWNGRNDSGQMLSSGIYFYTLTSDATAITKKMALVK
jgi:hypothetical protein